MRQDVRVENVTVRDEDWYRVLVGPFADRENLVRPRRRYQRVATTTCYFNSAKRGGEFALADGKGKEEGRQRVFNTLTATRPPASI